MATVVGDNLWHNSSTGAIEIWLMDGARVTSMPSVIGETGQPALIGPPWSIVGTGDFRKVLPPVSSLGTGPRGDQTFDTPPITSDLPLGASAHIVVSPSGDWTFTSIAHDSGFDNIDYTLAAVLMLPSGRAFTIQHQGHVEGTVAGLPFGTPRRSDPFPASGSSPVIAHEWRHIGGAIFRGSLSGTDTLVGGLGGFLGDLVKAAAEELGRKPHRRS